MKKIFLLVFLILLSISFSSCKKDAKVEFIGISQNESDSLSQGLDSAGTKLNYVKGEQWKIWDDYFKTFITSADWPFSERTYFGPSNNKGVGVIYNTKTGNPVYSLTKIDTAAANKVININPEAVGKSMKISGSDFNILIGTDVSSVGDASLQFALQHADSTEISADKYVKEEMFEGDFTTLINSDPKYSEYRMSALVGRNRLITKALRVKGFTAKARLTTNINASLKAKLDSGIVQKINGSNLDLKFKRNGDNTIVATSSKDFIVFVRLAKGKKIID